MGYRDIRGIWVLIVVSIGITSRNSRNTAPAQHLKELGEWQISSGLHPKGPCIYTVHSKGSTPKP